MTELSIVYLPPDALIPYEHNAKQHPAEQVEHIANSIREFGFRQPIVVDADNVVVIGHGRLMAAKKLGLESVPVVRADDLTDEQIRALRLADNKTNESEWDFAELEAELAELEMDFDMTDFGFEGIQAGVSDTPTAEEDDFDEDVPIEPKAKLGDIYQLGQHRLMCGDSTDVGAWARLMDGEKADMVFTDPPYGVDYASKNEYLNAISPGNRIQVPIENDALANAEAEKDNLWIPAFKAINDVSKDTCVYYITSPQGGELMMMMMMAIQESGWQLKHTLIWNKNNHVLGRSDYNYKHEPILYGWKKKHTFYGNGQFKTSVWDIPKPQKSDLHPTMKPVALVANAIMDGTKEGMIVLDAFGGSGTTIIAAEQLDRKARVMEIDPHYVDVIIARWENLTGEKAVLLNG